MPRVTTTVPPAPRAPRRLPGPPRNWRLDLDSRVEPGKYALVWLTDGRGIIHLSEMTWLRVNASDKAMELLDRAMRRAQSRPTSWVHQEIHGASTAPLGLLAQIVEATTILAGELFAAGPDGQDNLICRYRALREQLDSLRAEIDEAERMLDTTGAWLNDVGASTI